MSSNPTAKKPEAGSTGDQEERIKRFLATASHDLQSPLRHIAMYAEMLLDDLEPTLDSSEGPIITATPPKPSRTPASLRGFIRSSRVRKWATTTPQIGVVALRIEARPLAICVWLQPKRVNGSALLSVVPRKTEPIPALPPVLQVPDLSATMLVSMARVPLLVIVPPVRPVPATTLVTVPVPAGWQLTVPS